VILYSKERAEEQLILNVLMNPTELFNRESSVRFCADIWRDVNRFNRSELPSSSTGLVDVSTKTSLRNRKKYEQNVLAGSHLSHHPTRLEKTGFEVGNANLGSSRTRSIHISSTNPHLASSSVCAYPHVGCLPETPTETRIAKDVRFPTLTHRTGQQCWAVVDH
jgi:hypothetical protein